MRRCVLLELRHIFIKSLHKRLWLDVSLELIGKDSLSSESSEKIRKARSKRPEGVDLSGSFISVDVVEDSLALLAALQASRSIPSQLRW